MSPARSSHVGGSLVTAGWKQGVLLPPQPAAIVYDPKNPYTSAARALSQDLRTSLAVTGEIDRYAGIVRPKPIEFSIVLSQSCDIAAAPEVEPYVELGRAYCTNQPRSIEEARRSGRRFLLDPDRALIVDLSSPKAYVEKNALLLYEPQRGAPTEEKEREFAEWLARRYRRVALPDDFVDDVMRPMQAWLEEELDTDEGRSPYRRLVGMRLTLLRSDARPFAVRAIAVLQPDVKPGSGQANALHVDLSEFFARMHEAIVGPSVESFDFRERRLNELSAVDWLNSFEFEL